MNGAIKRDIRVNRVIMTPKVYHAIGEKAGRGTYEEETWTEQILQAEDFPQYSLIWGIASRTSDSPKYGNKRGMPKEDVSIPCFGRECLFTVKID